MAHSFKKINNLRHAKQGAEKAINLNLDCLPIMKLRIVV